MIHYKYIIPVLLCLLASCGKGKFHVNGEITNAKDSVLYFEHNGLDGFKVLDSVKLDTEGKFNFNLLEGYSFKTLNKNGIELTTASDHGGFTPQGLAADKLADYLVTLNNTLSQTYTVGSNGKISK